MLCDCQIEDSWKDYSSKRDHICGSDLNMVLRSPRHFQHSLLSPVPDPELLLSALKCYVLQGLNGFIKSYLPMERSRLPEPDKRLDSLRNNSYKKSMANDAKMRGKKLLFPDQYETLQEMVKSFRSNSKAMSLLFDCKYRENSFYGEIDLDGYLVKTKVRCDAISDNGYYMNIISSEDGSPDSFFLESYKSRLHVAEAFNLSVLNRCLPADLSIRKGYIVVVETVAPYLTQVYEFDETSKFLVNGKAWAMEALKRIKASAESGNYKGYDAGVVSDDGVIKMGVPE